MKELQNRNGEDSTSSWQLPELRECLFHKIDSKLAARHLATPGVVESMLLLVGFEPASWVR